MVVDAVMAGKGAANILPRLRGGGRTHPVLASALRARVMSNSDDLFPVILRCERSEPRRMPAEAPGLSPFEGRFAATSG